jgi:hypothetical protein
MRLRRRLRLTRLLFATAAGALCVRCGDDGPPVLTGVEPSAGPNDRPVLVTIRGLSLTPFVHVDVGCNGGATADAGFEARLATTPTPTLLSGVAWQPRGELAATVPPGLAPGEYDLTVLTPQGTLLTLPRAYRVLSPGAGDDGGTNDGGGSSDGPMSGCETVYAGLQSVVGDVQFSDMNRALGPPDGLSDSVGGQFSNVMGIWTFTMNSATQLGGALANARVAIILKVSASYVDDRIAIEVSPDGGNTWTTPPVVTFGPGTLPPRGTLAQVGPFDVPAITTMPAAGQALVRIRGAGKSGPSDTFDLDVDSVQLTICQ